MIGLTVSMDSGTRRWASNDIYSRGAHYEGRLMAPSVSSAQVDRWLPMSSTLSRSTFRLRDEDGSLFDLFAMESVAGREAEVLWLGEDADIRLLAGIVRSWNAGAGHISLQVDDPVLLRFEAAISPILGDIEPDVDENISGVLVPQVFGRATRLPVAGGLVRGGELELVAAVGEKEVTAVRYDGTLIDTSTWSQDYRTTSGGLTYTIIRVSGDNDRDTTRFEWSGGEEDYTIGSMIQALLLRNGVSPVEIDSNSFNALDALLISRGLQQSGDTPEGALVVIERGETISSILSRIQNSWGILIYLGPNGKFRAGMPVFDAETDVLDIPSDAIDFGGWTVRTPEGATEWEVESDRTWSLGQFSVQRTRRSAPNRQAFGAQIRGRAIQQWYARGHSALNFGTDRVLFERWNRLRGSVTLDPSVGVNVGDFVRFIGNVSTSRLPDETFFVDGMRITGSDQNLRRELSLSPLLGVGTNALTAHPNDLEYSVDAGDTFTQNLDDLFRPTIGGTSTDAVTAYRLDSADDFTDLFNLASTFGTTFNGSWVFDTGGSSGTGGTGPGTNNTDSFVATDLPNFGSLSAAESAGVATFKTLPTLASGESLILRLRVCVQGNFGDGAEGLRVQYQMEAGGSWSNASTIHGWSYSTSYAAGDTITDENGTMRTIAQDGGWIDVDVEIPSGAVGVRLAPRYISGSGFIAQHDIALHTISWVVRSFTGGSSLSGDHISGTAPFLHYGIVSAPDWLRIDEDDLTGTAPTVSADTDYTVVIRALDASGQAATKEITVSVDYTAPPVTAPTGTSTVSATNIGDSSATLVWDAIADAVSYTIEVDGTETTGLTTREHTITFTRPASVSARVRAVNVGGNGPWGTSATFSFALAPASAPTLTSSDFSIVGGSSEWGAPNSYIVESHSGNACPTTLGSAGYEYNVSIPAVSGATKYLIQSSPSSSFDGVTSQDLGTSRTHTETATESTRYFRAAAITSGGQTPWSDVLTATAEGTNLEVRLDQILVGLVTFDLGSITGRWWTYKFSFDRSDVPAGMKVGVRFSVQSAPLFAEDLLEANNNVSSREFFAGAAKLRPLAPTSGRENFQLEAIIDLTAMTLSPLSHLENLILLRFSLFRGHSSNPQCDDYIQLGGGTEIDLSEASAGDTFDVVP